MSVDRKVKIWSDGSSKGNPGRAGFGSILEFNGKRKEISEGFKISTNNRMELMGVIRALQLFKSDGWDIEVYTDSKYVVDSFNKKWVFNWEKQGFAGRTNSDLWIEFLREVRKHNMKFIWIKGHNGHPENERCDVLATTAADVATKIDIGYTGKK